MARTRYIKHTFFTNEELAEVDPLGRILFAGLWCHADREGRLENRPKKLKVLILPYDECSIPDLLAQLEKRTFIKCYSTDGSEYIQITNFTKHQTPHIKEQASTILPPDGAEPTKPLHVEQEANTKTKKKAELKERAREIIKFLNEQGGRDFDYTNDTTIEPVVGRLSEGATDAQCRQIIVRAARKWKGDPKMGDYIRPATLFGKKNFWQKYRGELVKSP